MKTYSKKGIGQYFPNTLYINQWDKKIFEFCTWHTLEVKFILGKLEEASYLVLGLLLPPEHQDRCSRSIVVLKWF